MMLLTRPFNLIGGVLVIYYVNLTLTLSEQIQRFFVGGALVVIFGATLVTILMALKETKTLREVLKRLDRLDHVDEKMGQQAGAEAVLFSSRHHVREAFVVPVCTVLPLCAFLWWFGEAHTDVLIQITIAGFLGISTVLLCTYFASERWMVPVIRYLLDQGISIDFDQLPSGQIHVRMNVCFTLAIAVTALMIGGLANSRAKDIILNPYEQAQAVENLRLHTFVITATAVVVGVLISRLLAKSIASRSDDLVQAMKRVQAGDLSRRVRPTGNDEIDVLARQFNAMVEELDRNDHVIRDLNTNLEKKVKRRTRELSKSKQSLQNSLRKLQEYDQLKTEFFSNVSHELRTPLTMILSPVERMIESFDGQMPDEASSLLQVTRVNANRLLKLINQLLDFSKLEAGHSRLLIDAFDINRLIEELTTAARPLAEQRGVELETSLDPRIPLFGADEEKIDTVLSNLLSNALKFTPAGGNVCIRSELLDGKICVSVTDTGIGISKEDQERVFERFVQIDGSTSREYSGTGLGLALSREFVELHRGEIHAEGEPGRGSRFWFLLPLAGVPEDIEHRPAARKRNAKAERFSDLVTCDVDLSPTPINESAVNKDAPRILIVDDTAEIRSMLGSILTDQYAVSFASDGEQGIKAVENELPDLIISDAMMPNVDGYEFCRWVKSNNSTAQIPFVMLTAKAELSMKIEGLEIGVDDYLSKPFDAEELRARVRSLLRLRRLHRELDHRNSELESTLQELRTMQTQLVHSEKMNSLGQIVAGIAHEINNSINAVYNGIQPLNKRMLQVQQLVEESSSNGSAERQAEITQEIDTAFSKINRLSNVIENGASRTAGIVSDLKTFAHPGQEQSEDFDLNESLEMCLNLLASQFRYRVEVDRDFGKVGMISAPAGQLNQVFMNLLSNAEQAIEGEGEIRVQTRRTDDGVTIRIRDNGKGIPAEVLPRIFDPFFTTKGPGVGTGLGLSISYGIINGIGGKIECHSAEGMGTEFLISLPQVTDQPMDAAQEECVLAASDSGESESAL